VRDARSLSTTASWPRWWLVALLAGVVIALLRVAAPAQSLFERGRPFPLLAPATSLAVEDLDGDGWPDLAMTHQSLGKVSGPRRS
jgi:hypothetical protein